MNTFCAVNDEFLAQLIGGARQRIVYIAPGLHLPVAKAIARRFNELGHLDVTLVLDASEDVCRIGFGEIAALELLHNLSGQAGFYIRNQPGLRVGALIVDDQTVIWAPTPRAVEEAPATGNGAIGAASNAPNGMILGQAVAEQIALATGADGVEAAPGEAEIGQMAVTLQQVAAVAKALADNPPIPVDLQRLTRVFSTKLQFVELEAKGGNFSRRKLSLSSDQMNADASAHLRSFLDSGFRPFGDFKDRSVMVPVFFNGKQAFDSQQKPLEEPVSEARLNRERSDIEAEYLYDITGFGALMEKARKAEFLDRVEAYKVRLTAHSVGMRMIIQSELEQIINDIVALILKRAGADGAKIDQKKLRDSIKSKTDLKDGEAPFVRCVFKDVTHEQTQDAAFRQRVDKAVPGVVRRRLGHWFDEFTAAKEGLVQSGGGQSLV